MQPKPQRLGRKPSLKSDKDQSIKPYSHIEHSMSQINKPSIYKGKPPRARRIISK